jgi:hypothetical protein
VGSGLSIGVRSECRQLDVTETGWRECVCEEVVYSLSGEGEGSREVFESRRRGGQVFERWVRGASGVSSRTLPRAE